MKSITQQKPLLQFFVGLSIGIASYLIMQLFFSLVVQLIVAIAISKNWNTSLIGPLAFIIPIIFLIIFVFILQKKMKSTILTSGVVAGWVGAIMSFQFILTLIL